VWKFILPNHLKEKVGGVGRKVAGEMPTELLEMADQELQKSALDFTEWARNYLATLIKLCEQAAAADPSGRRKHFADINTLAHELRGQGGTFGYPLITTVGKMLYESTMPACPQDDTAVKLVRAHVDTISAVIREKVSGDGGDVGRALLQSLQQAINRGGLVD
jgi:hypothetical protein